MQNPWFDIDSIQKIIFVVPFIYGKPVEQPHIYFILTQKRCKDS